MGNLVGKADGKQHMAGVERAGGAGRTRRRTNSFKVEHKQQRLALYSLKTHIYVAGETVLKASVDSGTLDFKRLGYKMLLNFAKLFVFLLHACGGDGDGLGPELLPRGAGQRGPGVPAAGAAAAAAETAPADDTIEADYEVVEDDDTKEGK